MTARLSTSAEEDVRLLRLDAIAENAGRAAMHCNHAHDFACTEELRALEYSLRNAAKFVRLAVAGLEEMTAKAEGEAVS
jgi:hypothetical protein